MTIELLNESFKEKVFDYEKNKEWVFEGDKPAIVDFWAEWCGPCRMVGPILDELSEDYKGKVDIYKVNVDENPELSQASFQWRGNPKCLWVVYQKQPLKKLLKKY